MGQRAAADYREDQPFRWNSVHKFESLVFKLLGVYIPVLTLLSFPCSFMVELNTSKLGVEPKIKAAQKRVKFRVLIPVFYLPIVKRLRPNARNSS